MTVDEIIKTVDAEVLQGIGRTDVNINYAFAADLMSDTLFIVSRDDEPILLITGVTNPSVVRTATILDIPLVLIVRGKKIPPETIKLAIDNEIILLMTSKIMFDSCGLLFEKGMKGCPWRLK
jgi:hypothetical protein